MNDELEVRFWSKVDKSGECWNWTGCKTGAGYGQIRTENKVTYAHRIAWELTNGKIPEGLEVCQSKTIHRPSKRN